MENLNEIIVTGAGIEKEKRDSGCRAWSSFDLHSMSAALLSIFSAIGASRSVGASREFSPTVNRSHSSFGDRPTERGASNIRIIRLFGHEFVPLVCTLNRFNHRYESLKRTRN